MNIDDVDLVDRGCSCHLGMAPCSYCVDTYECEQCGHRVLAEDENLEAVEKNICTDCLEGDPDDEPKAKSGDDLMEAIRNFSRGF